MKIGTDNKLAHLQLEYNELYEQTCTLGAVANTTLNMVRYYETYLSSNGGDRSAIAEYRKAITKYRSVVSQINRNNYRLQSLIRRINEETIRLQAKQMGYANRRRMY